jgi:hypothetical protein
MKKPPRKLNLRRRLKIYKNLKQYNFMAINVNDSPSGVSSFTPFQAWNRLEARPREIDYSSNLEARIYDPLWMLGKQWQMGEFMGSDTGTGIQATSLIDYDKFANITDGGINTDCLDMPLEPLLECLHFEVSLKERMQIWSRFHIAFQSIGIANISSCFIGSSLEISSTFISSTLPLVKVHQAHKFSDAKSVAMIKAYAKKGVNFDGYALFLALRGSINLYSEFNSISGGAVATNHPGLVANITTVITNLIAELSNVYLLPKNLSNNHWKSSKLCYDYTIETDNGTDEYCNSRWDGNLLSSNAFNHKSNNALVSSSVNSSKKEMLMTEARFAGMPSSRWWQFEDGSVNFCKLDANTTDIAKIILTQFTLLYRDDWFVVPYTLPTGIVADIKGIAVRDVFGVTSFVGHHTTAYDKTNNQLANGLDNWTDWCWFDPQSTINGLPHSKPIIPTESTTPLPLQIATKQVLCLPNSMCRAQTSPVIESVSFIRDEMSNIVWGLEETIQSQWGFGKEAKLAAGQFTEYLAKLFPVSTAGPIAPSSAALKYEMVQSVPENWIPFVKVLDSGRYKLQRATNRRTIEGHAALLTYVHPRTQLLQQNNSGVIPATNKKLFINDEEVVTAGTTVRTHAKRCRYGNGETLVWFSRSVSANRPTGSSGLVFDKVADK